MLAPEVWKFEPPPSSTRYKFVKNDKEIINIALSQYFNHHVSITIPDSTEIPPALSNILSEDSVYYYVKNVLASELVNFDFIDLFVRKGELTLLSVGTKLDEDDCLAITPDGKFILSLCRKSYQELGLEGKPSSFSNNTFDKYVVTIDLKESCFCPMKKNYERVLERLQTKPDLCFNIILAWEPHQAYICPSSIAAYLDRRGLTVKFCSVKIKFWVNYNVDVPVFNDDTDGESLAEWLGAFNLRCQIPESANGYITTYERPENYVSFGQVACLKADGLFTATKIRKLIEEIQNCTDSLTSWLGLNVNGFEDAVVNRGNQEHFFYINGDYHYTVFYRSQGPSLLCVHTSSTRRPKKLTTKKKRK